MVRLAHEMRGNPSRRNIAESFFDLALADRVSPATPEEIAEWRGQITESFEGEPTRVSRFYDYEPLPNVYFHGTYGNWRGLPAPAPSDPNKSLAWPPAIFMSPYLENARYFNTKFENPHEPPSPYSRPRIWVGVVDESRIHKDMPQLRAPVANPYTASVMRTLASVRPPDDIYGGGYGAIRPPAYESFIQDRDQVLVLDPFAVRWVDLIYVAPSGLLSIRATGEYASGQSHRPEYGEVAALQREAEAKAGRFMERTPLEDLRAHRWLDETEPVHKVAERIGYPSIIDPQDYNPQW